MSLRIIKRIKNDRINKKQRREIRKLRSKKVSGSFDRPRVSISRSNRYLIVQAIDDKNGFTLIYSSTKDEKFAKLAGKLEYSRKNLFYFQKLAEDFAEKLKKKGMINIVFDRNYFPYMGNLKKFCESLRSLGINF